jgi:phosphatidate cytidylyltransferase
VSDGQGPVAARPELPARFASAVVMGAGALTALLVGGTAFSAVVALVAVAGLIEWDRLVNGGHIGFESLPAALAVAATTWFAGIQGGASDAGLAILVGIGATALVAAIGGLKPLWQVPWHAAGPAYLGIPALALVALRRLEPGTAIVGGLFVAVWAADTAALFAGRAIGGPKLAPVLSPNKTWAGFFAGLVAAGSAEAAYAGFLHATVPGGFVFGFALALAGHCGDLFESWVKRQFHAKNSGNLIPGHGGMLDRIDSLLFAAPVCAFLIVMARFSPFGGAL